GPGVAARPEDVEQRLLDVAGIELTRPHHPRRASHVVDCSVNNSAAGERASFPTAWTPHGGRHTVATQLLQAGRPADSVRQLLGHASIRTTADVYGRGGKPGGSGG